MIMATEIELWIPTISALGGALIGGGFTAFVTWYSIKKQLEKDIWIKKMDKLEQVDKKLFVPFLECAYNLDVKRDPDDVDRIVGILRDERRYFIYCPKSLKRKFLNLYSDLERTIIKKEELWNNEFLDKTVKEVKQIEKKIYKTLMELKM